MSKKKLTEIEKDRNQREYILELRLQNKLLKELVDFLDCLVEIYEDEIDRHSFDDDDLPEGLVDLEKDIELLRQSIKPIK